PEVVLVAEQAVVLAVALAVARGLNWPAADHLSFKHQKVWLRPTFFSCAFLCAYSCAYSCELSQI
ncbi:hypothetical protein, partial [Methylobacillus glycogenes]|uniref:hypothetical protein n=1 Tax=Methylobacillus glycogenes TaxID=406 RepID=UPI001F3E3BD3